VGPGQRWYDPHYLHGAPEAQPSSPARRCKRHHTQETLMPKKEKIDPETAALIQWCTEVEGFLVAGGATLAQAQEHIEEQVEWFTDMFYDGLSPEEAAKAALH
jgi:hypothetical protein